MHRSGTIRRNPLGCGAEDKTAHLFTEFILPTFLDSLFMNLSVCMTLQQQTEFGWLLSCLFSHLPASMCLSAYLVVQGLSFVHQNVSAMQTLSVSLSLPFFCSLFFRLSSLSIAHLCHQTSSSILWSFIPSLKHFKLWWWLANLSQINLMGSACTHSPTGVLLLQCY